MKVRYFRKWWLFVYKQHRFCVFWVYFLTIFGQIWIAIVPVACSINHYRGCIRTVSIRMESSHVLMILHTNVTDHLNLIGPEGLHTSSVSYITSWKLNWPQCTRLVELALLCKYQQLGLFTGAALIHWLHWTCVLILMTINRERCLHLQLLPKQGTSI